MKFSTTQNMEGVAQTDRKSGGKSCFRDGEMCDVLL